MRCAPTPCKWPKYAAPRATGCSSSLTERAQPCDTRPLRIAFALYVRLSEFDEPERDLRHLITSLFQPQHLYAVMIDAPESRRDSVATLRRSLRQHVAELTQRSRVQLRRRESVYSRARDEPVYRASALLFFDGGGIGDDDGDGTEQPEPDNNVALDDDDSEGSERFESLVYGGFSMVRFVRRAASALFAHDDNEYDFLAPLNALDALDGAPPVSRWEETLVTKRGFSLFDAVPVPSTHASLLERGYYESDDARLEFSQELVSALLAKSPLR